jgi:hypothetical protein
VNSLAFGAQSSDLVLEENEGPIPDKPIYSLVYLKGEGPYIKLPHMFLQIMLRCLLNVIWRTTRNILRGARIWKSEV